MLLRREAPDGLVVYRSPALESAGVEHAFTTRRGPGGADLELEGLGLWPHPAEARLLAELALGASARLVRARQVHGAGVLEVGVLEVGVGGAQHAEGDSEAPPAADALVSSDPGLAVLVFSADCVPILLARADGRRVAAVHAGWRGLVAGVIPRALEALRAGAPRGPGSELVAAIGPCLSLARFEVGEEVAQAFCAVELGAAVHPGRPPARPRVDLRGAAALQLARGGVGRLDVDGRCTWEDPELHSYRRDVTHGSLDRTGRLAALIAPV